MTDRPEDVRVMRRDDPIGYVRWLHVERPNMGVCNDCREDWPCATYRALSALTTERDQWETERNDFQRLYLIWKDKHDELREMLDLIMAQHPGLAISRSASPPEQEA